MSYEDLVTSSSNGDIEKVRYLLEQGVDAVKPKTHNGDSALSKAIIGDHFEIADLLVVGTHGYTGWNRLAMGSVSEYIVRHSPCAVLTIKPTEHEMYKTG